MSGIWIWLVALLLYGAFRLWYDNWRGPLTPAEVEHYMSRLSGSASAEHTDLPTIRAFLEQDDGREFVMLNVVRVHPGSVRHPATGGDAPARTVLQDYFKNFARVLLRQGGHPAYAARPVGGYVDSWNAPPDPGWNMVGLMRYRSRRDMVILATDPRFLNAHAFKIAAIDVTFSFPTAPMLMLFVSPRVWVGLLLALLAALAHLGVRLAA